ncbi:hypothetical protein Pyn_22922 [Prunus yedoensis var. nudiflora]|uniref:Uncharacterized protein n=1 Tax=Prunus yedoensis var. nudiflora TaxID=2094558 RepID=A0A314UUG3_PRUYE|nr:hypothetical protein Pyn_22922 [Prunus yedoensis var. nudiflora]
MKKFVSVEKRLIILPLTIDRPEVWSTKLLGQETINLPNSTIDRPNSRARDCSLPKSDQSPIRSDQFPELFEPCEDVSNLSLTPTNNT